MHLIPENFHALVGGSDQSPGYDSSDGIAANTARLSGPTGMALDGQGNLYLVDQSAQLVRKVNASDGTIHTIAGGGSSQGVTGPGTGAMLTAPEAIAVAAGGTVYIADPIDNVIYQLTTSGTLSVVAGVYQSAGYSVDGTVATSAHIAVPEGVAVDANGLLYFSEHDNNVVRRVNADGTLTTVAGNHAAGGMFGGDGGPATAASLWYPFGIAFQPNGNLIVVDMANQRLRSVDATSGTIKTIAGDGTQNNGYSCGSGDGKLNPITSPQGVATDAAGQIYFKNKTALCKLGLDGTVSQIAGSYSEFGSGLYGFGHPALQTMLGQQTTNPVAVGPDGSAYAIASGGDGEYAVIGRLGPDSLMDFGTVPVRSSGAPATLAIIENTGTGALVLASTPFTVSGDGYAASSASGITTCVAGASLAPGSTCRIGVTFLPTRPGHYTGTLTIQDSLGTQTILLDGYGQLPASQTTLTITPGSVTAGAAVTLAATVVDASSQSAVTSGTVVFTNDNTGSTLATAPVDGNGHANASVTPGPGTYAVSANFQATNDYAASSSDESTLTVTAVQATITLQASTSDTTAGANVLVSATVVQNPGPPAGYVTFLLDGSVAATSQVQNGVASANITAPAPGVHVLSAFYPPANMTSNTLSLRTHGGLLVFAPATATTYAGVPADDLHGGYSGDGGQARAAHFNTPNGVVVDGGGNLYIADERNNVVRKVDVNGVVTTVAGVAYTGNYNTTRYSGDGGAATSAYMTNPSGVAVSPAGDLYIADYSNHRIRKVTASTGIITTVAGTGVAGFNGYTGVATSIQLLNPAAAALDTSGNLYIADTGGHEVRKVDTSGNLTTIAGDHYGSPNNPPAGGGPAMQAYLQRPMGVAVGADGSVYIADSSFNLIEKVTPDGTLNLVAGSLYSVGETDNVQGTTTQITYPQQMAVDAAGNLYFAELGVGAIRKLDPSGLLTTVIGYIGGNTAGPQYDPAGAPADSIKMASPTGVAIGPDGSVYAPDSTNQTVLRAAPVGSLQFGPNENATTPRILTLTNVGDAALTFQATPYTVSGGYSVSSGGSAPCALTSLAAAASCTLAVSNATTGGHTGTLTFSSNAMSPQVVTLATLAQAQGTAITLYLSETTGTYRDNVFFTAQVTVSGKPAQGTVNFYYDATLVASAQVDGSGFAQTALTTLPGGTHNVTAVYQGYGVYAPSTSNTVQLTLSPAVTGVEVGSTPLSGTGIILRALLTTSVRHDISDFTGIISFYEGGTFLGSGELRYNAVSVTTSLSPGTHMITAVYGGSANFAGSTSDPYKVTIAGDTGGGGGGGTQGLDYVLQLSSVPIVVHRGETKTIGVSASQFGANYQGTVTLACGTLPSYVTCSFSPATLLIGGPVQNLNSVLTITAAAGNAASSHAVTIVPAKLVTTKP